MPTEVISPEVECLKLKAALNENHRLAQKSATDAIERALLSGDTLATWKKLLPHGKFEPFVEKHFDGSLRTARNYMQAHKGLSSLPKRQATAVLMTEDSMEGLLKRLKKDDSVAAGRDARASEGTPGKAEGGSNPPATAQISEKGRPGGAPTSSDDSPASSDPDSGEAADSSGEDASTEATGKTPQETDPRPPRSGTEQKAAPVDYGKCPACASTKWKKNDSGMVDCAKCGHPHGEPRGNEDEGKDTNGIARSKCVKTVESLMRALDDLNLLSPRAGALKQSIDLCKSILKTVQGWK